MTLTLPDYAGLVLDLRPSPNGSVLVTGPLAHRPWPLLGVLAERVSQALGREVVPVNCWHEGERVWICFIPRKSPTGTTRKQKASKPAPWQRTLFEEE